MATTYTITVKNIKGESFIEEVTFDLRGNIHSIAEDMNLGHRITTKRDGEEPNVTHYYYHNGRLTVRRNENQLTEAQRQGRRRF